MDSSGLDRRTGRALFSRITGQQPHCMIVRWRWWFPGFRGLALGPIVLVREPDPVLICHELQHVLQFYRQPLSFHVRYLFELWRRGYRQNPYEREAVQVQQAAAELLRAGWRMAGQDLRNYTDHYHL